MELCDNGLDDDGNDLADCYDPACASQCAESCTDARDDDGDGLVDCDDPDCSASCTEDCSDGVDDDADGKVDCDDLDCAGRCAEDCADGIDDDGDQLVDSEDPSCMDADGDGVWSDVDCDDHDPARGAAAPWFTDADGDGHGDPALPQGDPTCEPAPAGTGPGDDCDDADGARHPGAPEACLDGFDQDCDGIDPVCLSGDVGLESAEGVISAAFDAENIGSSGAIADGALLAAGLGRAWLYPPPLLGVLDTTGATEIALDIAGRPTVAAGGDGQLVVASPDASMLWILEAADPREEASIARISGGDGFGRAVAAGSVDDDDSTDLLVLGDGADVARLVRGPVFGSIDAAAASTADFQGSTGTSCDLPGDLDGDGLGDAAVAAGDEIAVFLAPMGGNRPISGADATWLATGPAAVAGVGDADGDGTTDLAAANPDVDTAWILGSLPQTPIAAADVAVATLEAPGLSHAIGLGDENGDGAGDLAVQGTSYAWIFAGPLAGSADQSAASCAFVASPGEQLGAVLLSTDLNADGLSDLLLGAPDADDLAPASGAFYAFLGTLP